jgi:hypothetical protein
MSLESQHEKIQLGTPVGPYDSESAPPATPGDEVTFRGRYLPPASDKRAPTVSKASVVAASLAFVMLVFILSAIGLDGLGGKDDTPLHPAELAESYASYVARENMAGLPDKIQVQSRLEGLKYLEDCGFVSEAKHGWIEVRLLTCADDSNPVCRFASNRVRSLK